MGAIKKHHLLVILILALIPSVWFLLLPGFFESDDGEWMVIRFSAFYQALADGQFPVRFLGRLNHGYGYPVANFLYPGFMYFGVPLHVLGLSFVNTVKVVLVFSMVGTAFFSYFWLSKVFDKFSAIIGSIVLTYTPYHLFDLYKRGSVGELFAFAWVAFILWMIEAKNTFFVSIGIFLLAISHNTMFLLFAPLLFAYSLLRKTLSLRDTVISFGLGILMSSFFVIPALYELQFTNFAATKISDVSQYFVGLSLIGVSSLIILLLSLYAGVKVRNKNPLFILFFVVSILSIIMSLSISQAIWDILPSNLIQFPFRFLSYLIFGLGFLAAFAIHKLKKQAVIAGIIIVGSLIFSAYEYISPSKRVFKDDSFYSTNEATTTVQDEYMPIWVKEKPTERYKNKVEIVRGSGEIKNISYNDSKRITFEVKDVEAKVRVNTLYYEGWEAEVNGIPRPIHYDNDKGVIELNMGLLNEKNVEINFREPLHRTIANIISVLAFMALVFWSFVKRNKHG